MEKGLGQISASIKTAKSTSVYKRELVSQLSSIKQTSKTRSNVSGNLKVDTYLKSHANKYSLYFRLFWKSCQLGRAFPRVEHILGI